MRIEKYKIEQNLNKNDKPPFNNDLSSYSFGKSLPYELTRISIIGTGTPVHSDIQKIKGQNVALIQNVKKDEFNVSTMVAGAIGGSGHGLTGFCNGCAIQNTCVIDKSGEYFNSSILAGFILGMLKESDVIASCLAFQYTHDIDNIISKLSSFNTIIISIDQHQISRHKNSKILGIIQKNNKIFITYKNITKQINFSKLKATYSCSGNKDYFKMKQDKYLAISLISSIALDLCAKIKRGHQAVIQEKAYMAIMDKIS